MKKTLKTKFKSGRHKGLAKPAKGFKRLKSGKLVSTKKKK